MLLMVRQDTRTQVPAAPVSLAPQAQCCQHSPHLGRYVVRAAQPVGEQRPPRPSVGGLLGLLVLVLVVLVLVWVLLLVLVVFGWLRGRASRLRVLPTAT